MEFEIKDLDFETLIKLFNNLIDILDSGHVELVRISRALETIAQEMVVDNETL